MNTNTAVTEYTYVKLNDEPLTVDYVPDEHDEARDFQPSFWWRNKRYYLEEFDRCHNNPWIETFDFPEFIHGMQNDGSRESYVDPLFVEIVDGGDAINLYHERIA